MNSGFGPIIVFNLSIPGTGIVIPVTQTVTVTWLIMVILALTFILLTRNLEKIPKKVQIILELLVETIVNLTKSTMGEDKVRFAPYMGSLLIFLAVANLVGLVGIRPPTADINTTMALSLLTFFLIHYNAIKSQGLFKRIKGFTEPFILLTPINLIGEVATPISLGFRLFGNLVGGLIITSLLYSMLASFSAMLIGPNAPPILQIALPIPFHMYFDIFAGLLQSFIFTMLTMVNISMAMD